MNYLKVEHQKDININIVSLVNILETIKDSTKGRNNIEVLLYSEYFKAKDIVKAVNTEWNDEFYNYLIDNNIKIAEVITVTPEQVYELEKKKQLVIA